MCFEAESTRVPVAVAKLCAIAFAWWRHAKSVYTRGCNAKHRFQRSARQKLQEVRRA